MNESITRILYEHEEGSTEGTLEIEGNAKEVFDAVVRVFAAACQAYHFDTIKFSAALPELIFIDKHIVSRIMTDIGAIKRAKDGGDE